MSLTRITLKDFVIVNELALDLANGYTALTGETGAGKSILIDALQFALGGRADTGLIRAGSTRTDVSVEFEPSAQAQAWLLTQEMAPEGEAGMLLVRRTLDQQGRSRAWINGVPSTATLLRELGERLLDIHGQHAWQALMRADTTLALLDAYGRVDTSELGQLWSQWKDAESAWQHATQQAHANELLQQQLAWRIQELEKLAPQPGEWEALQAEHLRLGHAQDLIESAQNAADLLDAEAPGAIASVAKAAGLLGHKAHIEPRFGDMQASLEQALALLDDVARDAHSYARKGEADPQRLAWLEQRISTWMSLAKRLRCTAPELPQLLVSSQQQLAELEADTDLDALRQRSDLAKHKLIENSKKISALRHDSSNKLATEITSLLQQLGMQGGRFDVRLTPLEQPQRHGMDQVEFLVAGHAGATPRPVAKVASGGELSRISLAIAVTTSQLGGCPTLIFDEVDSGIGGAVAHTVGQLMRDLGTHRQVLAVTHLPQVAARAHHHLRVAKTEQGQQGVVSSVQSLAHAERVVEIARMLGGSPQSETSLAHAREMLEP